MVVHDRGYLSVLVPVDVDSSEDGQGRQLLLFDVDNRSGAGAGTFGQMLGAVDGLVFEENTAFLNGAAQMEDGRASQFETLDAGSVPAAVETRLGQALLQSRVDVHRPLTILGNLGRH